MRVIQVLILAVLLAGVGTNDAQAGLEYTYTQTERVWILTASSKESARAYADTSVHFLQWVLIGEFTNVPLMPAATKIDAAKRLLAEVGLEVVSELDDFLFVEGESTAGQAEALPLTVVYEFVDGQLVSGPLPPIAAFHDWYEDGYNKREVGAIVAAGILDGLPGSLNDAAWLLATTRLAAARDPARAIELATQANEASDWDKYAYLDTLAAAYAAAGNFPDAVAMQTRAVARYDEFIIEESLSGEDVDASRKGMVDRLHLFGEEHLYTLSSAPQQEPPENESEKEPAARIQKAALEGKGWAQYQLGLFYIRNSIETAHGLDDPGNWWLEAAANNGHLQAQRRLGMLYLLGQDGFSQDFDKARHWLDEAAEQDDRYSVFNRARLHDGKYGSEIDDVAATAWYERAARLGFQPAMIEFAFRVGEGVGIAANPALKKQYLDALTISKYRVPDFVDGEGIGLQRSGVEPMINFLNAATTSQDEYLQRFVDISKIFGLPLAQDEPFITWEYEGQYMIVDTRIAPSFAAYFAEQAARLGNAEAQRMYADFLDRGFGVKEWPERAEYWRTRARDNPNRMP